MKKQYAFTFNGAKNWLLGVVPEWRVCMIAKTEDTGAMPSIWRNHIHDGYKICEGY
jgi:hypothetical protein